MDPGRTVCIGGLHTSMTLSHVELLLSPYGDIRRLQMMPTKGYAACLYHEATSATLAVSKLHERLLMGRQLTVQLGGNHSWMRKRFYEHGGSAKNNNNIQYSETRVVRRKLQTGGALQLKATFDTRSLE